MKATILPIYMIAGAILLPAQITATLNRLPNGSDEVKIRNDFASYIAAFVVTVNQAPRSDASSHAPLVVYSDPLIDPKAMPLLPGEERKVMMMGVAPGIDLHGKHLLNEPIVTAGIFADGTTTGDAGLLTALVLRRSNMLLAVETTLDILSEAGRRNVPRGQMIEQFKKTAESLSRWYLPPEQQIGVRVYQAIIAELMNLPEGPVGSPFPPSAFVEEETSRLRQQRIALLESEPNIVDAFHVSAR
jgi:hypothetical protein